VPLWSYALSYVYIAMLKPYLTLSYAISPAACQLIFNL